MNKGLIYKTIHETWLSTVGFAAALFAFQIIVTVVLPSLRDELTVVLENLKFVQYIIAALLGTGVSDTIGPQVLSAVPWVHPVMLTLVGAHAIMFCTRVPAGEIDGGTIDLLLGLPVGRPTVIASDTVVFVLWGVLLTCGALAGSYLGTWWASVNGSSGASWRLAVAANLFCEYLVVGSIAWVVSALSERRGRAVGVVFAIVVASFVLNTLATFNETFRSFSFLGLMNYYRPLRVLRGDGWPIADMVVLLVVAGVLWCAAILAFARRDVRTV